MKEVKNVRKVIKLRHAKTDMASVGSNIVQ